MNINAIRAALSFAENERVEFIPSCRSVKTISKTVAAFLNSHGGTGRTRQRLCSSGLFRFLRRNRGACLPEPARNLELGFTTGRDHPGNACPRSSLDSAESGHRSCTLPTGPNGKDRSRQLAHPAAVPRGRSAGANVGVRSGPGCHIDVFCSSRDQVGTKKGPGRDQVGTKFGAGGVAPIVQRGASHWRSHEEGRPQQSYEVSGAVFESAA